MPQLQNYNKNETLATGFTRPKVTSLFFDKIWLPKSLTKISHEYSDIPSEVLICEKSELQLQSDDIVLGTNNSRIGSGEFYEFMLHSNLWKPEDSFSYIASKNLIEENFQTMKKLEDYLFKTETDNPQIFKYSKHRNHAIFVSAENFSRQYNLYISPIYHNLTEFEKEIKSINYIDLNFEKNDSSNNKNDNLFINKSALTISIQDFPSIIEEKLSWEQVLDFRKDKKNTDKLKRFTEWSTKKLTNKNQNEIREILEKELDDYKKALKEHGIKTATGTFSTIVSSANAINTILSGGNPILPLLSVSSLILTFSVNTHFSNLKNKNNPIAYIYDLTESFY